MSTEEFTAEIHDQPDVLVRIMQIIHRRGGHIRVFRIDPPEGKWAKMHMTVADVQDPQTIARTLEKLIDVHSVHTNSK